MDAGIGNQEELKKKRITYIVLVPHDVQERIKWQVIVSSAEAGECAENAASEEHSVQMFLCVRQDLLHLLSWILLRAHLACRDW